MADIRPVTPEFSVAPQILPGELAAVAQQGFRLVINNRPDGEEPDQPGSAEMAEAARQAGLDYMHIPVRGGPGPAQVQAMGEAVRQAEGPMLAFCRSGTRSIAVWAVAEAAQGRPVEEVIRLARDAGYDLSGLFG